MGLFDPERFRGWGGGKRGPVTLSETDATPSYLPGPIRPGEWKLLLGVPNIRAGVRSQFRAKIYFAPAAEMPLRTGTAWYRGDLHLHTAHSDGSCLSQTGKPVPCPAFKILEAAAAKGLDFVAITDHNTTSHYDAIRELQPYFDRLLVIRGREITTFEGHANVYGTTELVDFRVGSPSVPTMNALLQRVQSLDGLFSINHPNERSGEACMGCGWTAADANFALVQAVEAVNDGNGEGPLSGIPFWEAQLNRGFHLTAIGGSDTHRPDANGKPRSGVGYPTTAVMASELSEPAILEGIRAGHVFIDLEGRRDRRLEFSATSGGNTARMGDALDAPAGATVHFTIRATHGSGARMEAIEDGRPVPLMTESFDRTSDGRRHWIRINLRDQGGRLLLVGNPIYY